MKIIPKIIQVDVKNLFLDAKNPRLPENIPSSDQNEIWKFMKQAYDLDELALSMVMNGYFEAEPMVVIPKDIEFSENQENEYNNYKKNPNSQYIVVEGNRRLSAIRGLIQDKFIDSITEQLKEQFKKLPVLFYPNRDDVLGFLGVHHLSGVRKWNVYERARFIAQLKLKKKMSIEDIQRTIGDRKNSAKKTYVCYCLIGIIEEYDGSFDTRNAKSNFSFLQLATGQGPIRDFIGLPFWQEINSNDLENPIPDNKRENLKFLFECLFDNGNEKKRLIKESRDITGKLSKILEDENATTIFKQDRNIDYAFNMIGGELDGLNNLSGEAQKKLETINGKLSSMDIKTEVSTYKKGKELQKKIVAISSVVRDINRKFENE